MLWENLFNQNKSTRIFSFFIKHINLCFHVCHESCLILFSVATKRMNDLESNCTDILQKLTDK